MQIRAGHNNAEPFEVGIEDMGVRVESRTFSKVKEAEKYYEACRKKVEQTQKVK